MKLRFYDPEKDESGVPYVVETSIGLDLFLAGLSNALRVETLEDGSAHGDAHPGGFCPGQAGGLADQEGWPAGKAREIMNLLKLDHSVQYDEKDAIGRRYRRQDAIGTPLCITIDHDTLEDNAVTLRDRDTMEQVRVPIAELPARVSERVGWSTLFS